MVSVVGTIQQRAARCPTAHSFTPQLQLRPAAEQKQKQMAFWRGSKILCELPTQAPDPQTLFPLFRLGSRLPTQEMKKQPRLPTLGPRVGRWNAPGWMKSQVRYFLWPRRKGYLYFFTVTYMPKSSPTNQPTTPIFSKHATYALFFRKKIVFGSKFWNSRQKIPKIPTVQTPTVLDRDQLNTQSSGGNSADELWDSPCV